MQLQQYLPFTVLKPQEVPKFTYDPKTLQQYLPFTVLKPYFCGCISGSLVATVLTVHGIETFNTLSINLDSLLGCNSTYRLRYATNRARQ